MSLTFKQDFILKTMLLKKLNVHNNTIRSSLNEKKDKDMELTHYL